MGRHHDLRPVIYMFLPLAHVLARLAQTVVLDVGGVLAYWSGDPTKILEEVKASAPTHFVAVPRIYEKMHTGVVSAVEPRFARIEQVKRFHILDHDLTQAAGELTPTFKLKRAFVYERYADVFDALYEDGAGSS